MKKENISNPASDSELRKLLKQHESSLIIYLLKRLTSPENPISAPKLAGKLNELISRADMDGSETYEEYFNDKTTQRKLDKLIIQNQNSICHLLNHILTVSSGGLIKSALTSGQGQNRYYFEPLLTASDLNLICGSLRSCRYLSERERQFLISKLRFMYPEPDCGEEKDIWEGDGWISAEEAQFKRPSSSSSVFPGMNPAFLDNTKILSEAIEKKVQIELKYGIFDISESGKVDFHARKSTPYILNPFALLWNDGEYYLIANSDSKPTPWHFRVDRIIDVKIHRDQKTYEEVKRGEIPESLKPFYERDEAGKDLIFNEIKYANTYPSMAIYESRNLTSCTFECTKWSLQILVDNFGPDLMIKESNLPHDPSEVDYVGRRKTFLLATVKQVQYENAMRFAINNCQYLTLVSPSDMVNEVYKVLMQSAQKLRQK